MKAFAGAALVFVLLAAPAAAQQTGQTQEKSSTPVVVKTMADGMLAGQVAAEMRGTGGSFAGGLAGGLLLGLIGTGIAYAAQGPAEIPVAYAAEAQKYGSEYVLGFQQGFAEKSKKKKRGAALTGGLLGTGALVVLVLSASGN